MYQSISTGELKSMIGRINIIDIRDNYLYNLSKIPTSINIPINYLLLDPKKYLKKEEKYYIYCLKGIQSVKACTKLYNLGYNVINVDGGYNDYINKMN